ncbi:TPA: hypothetical protein U2C46_000475 [Streptococcus suis]|nr:hypothetical protein [Streptococcus suis]
MTELKQEEKQMVDILKSLADNDLTIPIIILGLVREARLWHKQVLEHKRNLQTKSKSKGRKPQPLICSIPPFAKESDDLLVSWFVVPVVCHTADCEAEKEEVKAERRSMGNKISILWSLIFRGGNKCLFYRYYF